MEIPPKLEGRVQQVLDRLNTRLLNADPRLAEIADTLSGATRIAARDLRDGGVNLRLVPLKSWDLLSKAEIILRNEPDWPWLPLQRHGQGMQSLSVIFLFQAFVKHLLAELYEPESVPVLALEEPETHLHPQAAPHTVEPCKQIAGAEDNYNAFSVLCAACSFPRSTDCSSHGQRHGDTVASSQFFRHDPARGRARCDGREFWRTAHL